MIDFESIGFIEHPRFNPIPNFHFHKDAKKAKRQKRAIKLSPLWIVTIILVVDARVNDVVQ